MEGSDYLEREMKKDGEGSIKDGVQPGTVTRIRPQRSAQKARRAETKKARTRCHDVTAKSRHLLEKGDPFLF